MRFSKSLLFISLSMGGLLACVTEVKESENNKPYVATLPQDVVLKEIPHTKGGASLPGRIVIKCHSKYDKDPKFTVCGATTVSLFNELTKTYTEHSFKGEKLTLAVARGTSYSLEIKTKGCSEKRVFSGMTEGMALTAQFDNCAVK
ncbi:MAG: hypothetical protein ACXVB1_13210 [Pseudobdellovibrionaceae bacterium]